MGAGLFLFSGCEHPGKINEVKMENLEGVKKYLTDHKDDEDVKKFLGELTEVSEEQKKVFVEDWISSNDGKRHIQSLADKEADKRIKTWEENNIPKIREEIEEDIKLKLDPPKNPEIVALTKRLEKAEAEREEERRKNAFSDFRSEIGKEFKEKNVPDYILDLVSKDFSSLEERKSHLSEQFYPAFDQAVKNFLAEQSKLAGREFPGGGDNGGPPDVQKAYDEAKNSGNMAQQVAIKRYAARENIPINS